MAYNFFSQPQGPNIDINLFGNAATQGAALGRQIPSPITSIIQGGIQGYEEGQKIRAQDQQNEIRQNQIEQQPVENQIRENLARQDQAKADIMESSAYINSQTETQRLELTKSDLDQQVQDIQLRKNINELLSNDDPNIRAWVYQDPKYAGILSRDTKLNEFAFGRAKDGLSPEEQDSVLQSIDLFKARDLKVRENAQAKTIDDQLIKSRDKAVEEFQASPSFNYVTRGMTPQEVKEQIDVRPNSEDPNAPLDKSWLIFKKGQPVLKTSETEAAKFLKLKNIEDTLGRSSKESVYGAPDPLQQAQANKAATNAANTGNASGQVTDGGLGSFQYGVHNAPGFQLGKVSGQSNQNIVEQAQREFQELTKNPPPGQTSASAEEKLLQMKAAIRAGYTAKNPAPKFSNESYNILQYLNEVKQPGTTVSTGPKIDTTTPSAALSGVAGTTVIPQFDTTFKVANQAKERINSNSLLANEPPLIKGLVTVESGGKEDAMSPTGVRGLAQVTKATAAQYGLNRDIPEENVLAAKLYINQLWNQSGKDIRLALAGYNAGPSNIAQAVDRAGTTEWTAVREELKGILSPKKFKEVYNYPDRVLSASTAYLGQNVDDDNLFYGLLQVGNLVDYS